MKDIGKHYGELSQKCNGILAESINSQRLELTTKSHASIFDYNLLIESINGRPEYDILRIAIREYQMAILSLNLGFYNQAFYGLRFFFERTLVAIMFSSKELDFQLWRRGERDTYWREIVDQSNGIFSHPFCRAFFPDLEDESKHFNALSQKVYRECSEYVHGNLSVQDKIPTNLEFSAFLCQEWHVKANIIRRIVVFSFCLRYIQFIKPESLRAIESIVLEEFGHLTSIRSIFNK